MVLNAAGDPQKCCRSCYRSNLGAHHLHIDRGGGRQHAGLQDISGHGRNHRRPPLPWVLSFVVFLPAIVVPPCPACHPCRCNPSCKFSICFLFTFIQSLTSQALVNQPWPASSSDPVTLVLRQWIFCCTSKAYMDMCSGYTIRSVPMYTIQVMNSKTNGRGILNS